MTRFSKIADLLYFKGKISNKHIFLNEVYDKEIDNNFNIIVTAENGSINIYKITITRQAEVKNEKENKVVNTTGVKKDSDSLLKELIINNNRIQLDENTFLYKYTVLYKVETLNIDAKAKSSKSKVKISLVHNFDPQS